VKRCEIDAILDPIYDGFIDSHRLPETLAAMNYTVTYGMDVAQRRDVVYV
jgi:hypothetical protein